MSFQTRLLSPQGPSAVETAQDATSYRPLLQLNQYNPQRYPYLLASSADTQSNTRFDILLACPQFSIVLNADKKLHKITADGRKEIIATSQGFFSTLHEHYQQDQTQNATNPDELPFTGGWFIYLSYEMAEEIEPCLSLPVLPAEQPLAVASRCPAAIIVDKKTNKTFAIAETKFVYLLDEIERDFKKICQQPTVFNDHIELLSLFESETAAYLRQVEKVKRYIIDGDIFQANLSRKWLATVKDDITDADLFQALARQNPSSFAALACFERMSIISSSPERLVSIKGGIVETRPIAGTRPRNLNLQNDTALAKELLEHPKEQAEHIMLIDLERNDLGRVCRPGSIEVNELMHLESWQHVHHIVSNVRGELLEDKSPIDVIRAVFPGGTITGCPKVRCMEILAEMEQQPRSAYTGSLGYLNNDGSMDLNILIRTMLRDKTANQITFRAGGGIVSDSIAENELAETRAKAKGLLKIFNRQADTSRA